MFGTFPTENMQLHYWALPPENIMKLHYCNIASRRHYETVTPLLAHCHKKNIMKLHYWHIATKNSMKLHYWHIASKTL